MTKHSRNKRKPEGWSVDSDILCQKCGDPVGISRERKEKGLSPTSLVCGACRWERRKEMQAGPFKALSRTDEEAKKIIMDLVSNPNRIWREAFDRGEKHKHPDDFKKVHMVWASTGVHEVIPDVFCLNGHLYKDAADSRSLNSVRVSLKRCNAQYSTACAPDHRKCLRFPEWFDRLTPQEKWAVAGCIQSSVGFYCYEDQWQGRLKEVKARPELIELLPTEEQLQLYRLKISW